MSTESKLHSQVGQTLGTDLFPKAAGAKAESPGSLPHDYRKDGVQPSFDGRKIADANEVIAAMRKVNLTRRPRVTFPLPQFPTELGWRHRSRHGQPIHDQREWGGRRSNVKKDPATGMAMVDPKTGKPVIVQNRVL